MIGEETDRGEGGGDRWGLEVDAIEQVDMRKYGVSTSKSPFEVLRLRLDDRYLRSGLLSKG